MGVKPPSFWKKREFQGIVAAVILLTFAAAYTVASRPPATQDEAAAEAVAVRAARLQHEEELRGLEAKDTERKKGSAIAVAKLRRISAEGEKALTLVGELSSELKRWDDEIATLLNDDRGRYIAASDDGIRSFESIWKKKRPKREDAAAIEERIKLLLAP